MSQALNIRGGPGISYAIVGHFAADGDADIVGQSSDGLWWKVACPDNLDVPECWLVADPLYSLAVDVTKVPVALAPAVPPPTPSPTAVPCVVSPPSGWHAYQVQPGDTFYDLAEARGTDVGRITEINCVDQPYADRVIYLPALPSSAQRVGQSAGESAPADTSTAIAVAPATAADSAAPLPAPVAPGPASPASTSSMSSAGASRDANAAVSQVRLDGTITTDLITAQQVGDIVGFTIPNQDWCEDRPAPTPTIFVGQGNRNSAGPWNVGEAFGICFDGFDASVPISFTVTSELTGQVSGPTILEAGILSTPWRVDPMEPHGGYEVRAVQYGQTTLGRFEIESVTPIIVILHVPLDETLLTFNSGDIVHVGLAGFQADPTLHVCWKDSNTTFCAPLIPPIKLSDGEVVFELDTEDWPSNIYHILTELTSDPRSPRVTIRVLDSD